MNQTSTKVQKIISAYCNLSPRQKIILEARYCHNKSQDEVAKILRLSNERIRQLENQAIKIIEDITK